MQPVGKHTGDQVPHPHGRAQRSRTYPWLHVVGAGASVLAWAALVWLAIRIGSAARGGEGTAIVLLAAACLGAIACLFLGLLLTARIVDLLRNPPPPRPVGGRRAKR